MAEPLYRPLDFVMVRAPLLPVEAYLALSDPLSLLADARVRRAVVVGSPSLAGAVKRFEEGELSPQDATRMRSKLLRYQIRMATRPTPFGLFAGVALGAWGDATDLVIESPCAGARTRPDMGWLMNLALSAERIPEVRKRLKFYVNPLAVVEAGRLTLPEKAPVASGERGGPVSVRATGVVRSVLSLAQTPVDYEQLVADLCEATPSATPEKVDKLLTDLWEQTFLLTDVRPPLTTDDPARHVAARLEGIPEAADEYHRLSAFRTAVSHWDSLDVEASAPAFIYLLQQAGAPADGSHETPVQVDMSMSVSGRLGKLVAGEAARAVELLLRLSPWPRGSSSIAAYRQAFVGRYGHEREVPILELLDPHRGLGPPSNHGHAQVGPDPARAAARSRTLLKLACSALHERSRVVALDEDALARLETWRPSAEAAPLSLDLNFLLAAKSTEQLEAGNFTLIIGPNLGALAAGRNLGRFADLLAPEGPQALRCAAIAEQAQTPDYLCAELVYLPANFRSANVVIRPSVRDYEVHLGASAGVPDSRVIPLSELLVGVDGGRFYVRWPRAGKRVRFFSGHMLNQQNAPAAGRFLIDVSHDGRAMFSTFDWENVENFPYLPRVQAGRTVLRPAQWRIDKSDSDVDRWRAEWDVPRHVCLSIGDNRLVLDLDSAPQAQELRAELRKLSDGSALIVQEVLPSFDDMWLEGPGGRYASEFIASFVLPAEAVARKTEVRAPARLLESAPPRLHAPGSDWLFVKLYCPRDVDDDVISEMMELAETACRSGLADLWFYIRYADPESHLRLRFHGSADRLTRQLLPHVCEWASTLLSNGLCLRFVFDTYEQELERFGGAAGMAVAENVFAADSRCAAALLRAIKTKQWSHDLTALLALSIDDLLGSLGFDAAGRLRWYRAQTTAGGPETGAEYRRRKSSLRALLSPSNVLGDAIASVLSARRTELAPVAARLRELAGESSLSQSLDSLCTSFVHLHVNRMGSVDAASEQRILSLLLRTRESLEKAPLQRQSEN
jgi:thiopeptide-type bacteriocin biosynthesis protein